jgi:predicted DsbA family dithiol-disulfide isomerase
MVNRMGSERTLSAQKYMTSLGRAEGIEIKYGGKTGNTRISHQLLLFARSKSLAVQNKVAQELFRLHFSEERYIGDMQTLLDPAKNCGLDVNEVQEYLEQGVAAEEVDREAAAIQDLTGRKGVPNFRFQEVQYVVDARGIRWSFSNF